MGTVEVDKKEEGGNGGKRALVSTLSEYICESHENEEMARL